MGLVTITGTQLQYFSLSEEIIQIGTKFFDFIINISPGWILLVTAISLVFIFVGVVVRLRHEIEEA